MSSFKKRVPTRTNIPVGSRILSGSPSNFVTSTGIPSLDDILGGGLPLSCLQLVLAPDVHSAYGELLEKYFVAQGLAVGQDLCLISSRGREFLEECMWSPDNASSVSSSKVEQEEDEVGKNHDTKIKIAWRYEQMKQFQTSVPSTNHTGAEFCPVFDLTSRLPASIIDGAIESEQIAIVEVPHDDVVRTVLDTISQCLESHNAMGSSRKPLRICIPSFGDASWGDLEPSETCYFLYSLRVVLRRYPNACASVSLAPHLCAERSGGPGWIQKLGWLSDACISLSAFSGDVSLTSIFPSHHGFVHIHSLPSPSTLSPPSDKFSSLRGLTSSGENNLAFKCMRKRLIFETLHLDVEGGVGERRTIPDTSAISAEANRHEEHAGHDHERNSSTSVVFSAAAVEVQLEQPTASAAAKPMPEPIPSSTTMDTSENATPRSALKKPKQRKRVAFTSDRPDLYDF